MKSLSIATIAALLLTVNAHAGEHKEEKKAMHKQYRQECKQQVEAEALKGQAKKDKIKACVHEKMQALKETK